RTALGLCTPNQGPPPPRCPGAGVRPPLEPQQSLTPCPGVYGGEMGEIPPLGVLVGLVVPRTSGLARAKIIVVSLPTISLLTPILVLIAVHRAAGIVRHFLHLLG